MYILDNYCQIQGGTLIVIYEIFNYVIILGHEAPRLAEVYDLSPLSGNT